MDQCKNLVKNVNTWSETNRKLGKEMYTFVNTSTSIDSMIMKEYKESVVDLHDVFQKEYDETRRAITVILRVRVIARIESLLKSGTSNIDSIWKVRKNIMLDYESHVQKASLYEQKGEKSQANYFRQKAAHDKGMFKEHTSFLSGVFDTFIDSGSRLLMLETSTLVTCEMYMVKRQYDALAAIGNNIGEDIISAIMDELEDVIGRIRRGEDVEKSYVPPSLPFSLPSMETAPKYVPFHEYVKKENVDISKPIAVEALSDGEESVVSSVPEDHDFSPSLSPSAAPTTSSPMYPMWFDSDASNSFEWANEQEVDEDSLGEEEEVEEDEEDEEEEDEEEEDEEEEDEEEEDEEDEEEEEEVEEKEEDEEEDEEEEEEDGNEETTYKHSIHKVIAKNTFHGDEEGDLPFRKGDIITVLQTHPSGWWTGRLHGHIGIFPVTYVKRYS